MTISTRSLQASDSLEALAALPHQAYASLAAQGWNVTAATMCQCNIPASVDATTAAACHPYAVDEAVVRSSS